MTQECQHPRTGSVSGLNGVRRWCLECNADLTDKAIVYREAIKHIGKELDVSLENLESIGGLPVGALTEPLPAPVSAASQCICNVGLAKRRHQPWCPKGAEPGGAVAPRCTCERGETHRCPVHGSALASEPARGLEVGHYVGGGAKLAYRDGYAAGLTRAAELCDKHLAEWAQLEINQYVFGHKSAAIDLAIAIRAELKGGR